MNPIGQAIPVICLHLEGSSEQVASVSGGSGESGTGGTGARLGEEGLECPTTAEKRCEIILEHEASMGRGGGGWTEEGLGSRSRRRYGSGL